MHDEIKRTADWEPGTLEKTRRNIGLIDDAEAASMARKLGGEVLYERTSSKGNKNMNTPNTGRIVRNSTHSEDKEQPSKQQNQTPKRRTKEELPTISKKINSAIDKLMMSNDYKIKQNYGLFNFIRNLQKNGTEKINPELYEYKIKKDIEHLESFITVVKTLIQIAPATYKAKIVNNTESKYKFLRMIASWGVATLKTELSILESNKNPILTNDLIPITRAFYKQLITIYYFDSKKIPKLIKEIYNDESSYQDAPQEKLSTMAKQAITEWLYIDSEIIKKYYPLLMRMCSDTFEPYPAFFTEKVGEILKFTGLHKFDLLLPEKPKVTTEEQKPKQKPTPPQKGIKDSTVITGLKLLNQLFPQAGFDNLDEHPDMYPYFQPIYKFEEGFNMLSPENPIQVIMVLQRIIEDCFQGCRNIKFNIPDSNKKNNDNILEIMDDWSAYREETFERLYCDPLKDLTNSIYSQPDFMKSHIGKKIMTSLLWQTTYHFMPNFKFDQLLLEHPSDESKYRPLFHRTDFARKYLTLVVNECDSQLPTKGVTQMIENPWEHYNFEIKNEVSKRLDVLLGAQNKTANTNATNANLLKYTLCFISVLDWWINNPTSPAYTSDPMNVFRISPNDGKPQFSVQERTDQNSLFIESVKANYKRQAK